MDKLHTQDCEILVNEIAKGEILGKMQTKEWLG